MKIYDGKSGIRWFPQEDETPLETLKRDTPALFTGAVVLIDDGAGSVYDWRYLSVLADRYGAKAGATDEETLANIEAAMKVPPRDPLTELDEQAGAIEELAAMASGADVQAQLDEQAAAIEELANIVASNSKEESNG